MAASRTLYRFFVRSPRHVDGASSSLGEHVHASMLIGLPVYGSTSIGRTTANEALLCTELPECGGLERSID